MSKLDRKTLFALDNAAIIYQARAAGIKVYPEDMAVNYAEIDYELTSREDAMVAAAGTVIPDVLRAWLKSIKTADDVTLETLDLADPMLALIMDHIRAVWTYGGRSADDELRNMGAHVETFADPVTENEALAWYTLYARLLADAAAEALFVKMQPILLEAIDKGVTGTELVDMLMEDFGRYGVVRCDIIARTESTKAYNWGRRHKFDKSSAIAGYRYSAILDERVTEICKALHGYSWPMGDPDLDAYTPPNHYRCRSVIVPISRYATFTFQGPPAGWMDALPEKERVNLEKFMQSEWYPKPETVRKKDLPGK